MNEPTDVSSEELARIERFIAAYNVIDDFLQRAMDSPNTFRSAVDWFARHHPWWKDAETLRVFASLRNFLVHEKTRPFDYPCVPGEAATREIERIRDSLLRPTTIGETFAREVLTLAPQSPIKTALELVAKRGISRFPIYDGARFVGLLTENGIARHLADVVAIGKSFDSSTPIQNVLPRETKRRNYRFAGPLTTVSQVAFWFHDDTFLEAVLIGEEKEAPRGIVTRGDVAGY
jgi:CBS domain-containing protein